MTYMVWPIELRSLALERADWRTTRAKKAEWVLAIAGPFCFWPKGASSKICRAQLLCGSLSCRLGLPTQESHSAREHAFSIKVQLSQEERDRILRQEYAKIAKVVAESKSLRRN
jgi:hypothetical protein